MPEPVATTTDNMKVALEDMEYGAACRFIQSNPDFHHTDESMMRQLVNSVFGGNKGAIVTSAKLQAAWDRMKSCQSQ